MKEVLISLDKLRGLERDARLASAVLDAFNHNSELVAILVAIQAAMTAHLASLVTAGAAQPERHT